MLGSPDWLGAYNRVAFQPIKSLVVGHPLGTRVTAAPWTPGVQGSARTERKRETLCALLCGVGAGFLGSPMTGMVLGTEHTPPGAPFQC